ncbi:MAG: branched-chain amino acid ABC transporter ATP-binding protein [Candidatus Lambdaproteobacteria bacterium RIFOXYD12_FULL_49_8]|uniref:Branched-chain amino acid ABC transporter ATP-binding protein n=1 Tax=Candidatus Lambdaproteobacteria bacterium RIFOXYD2_FULL_50_16 TaxID=1817772 RepID=A0A1F6GGE9_9PROT|nr:MAG: branched-chain amino acid ABC transporter ATP-binding protein [Candidatus Lambdaproteobacteria bacterium RIFOXYD2_FULL_50_16]OGG97535.1 MAG: branched-chain amino acid ABC transporter ATP-binding protein [Candidatus Lambdaproteobacteria bacterium RIFOXYD12_FULL_49_8]
MLELKGLRSGYQKIEVLHGIDLKVEPGEIVTLIGANGAGKSTCLLTISGLVRATSGEIWFDGKRMDQLKPDQIVGLGLVQVPEGRRILKDFTVLENLEMGAYLRRDKEVRRDLAQMTALFPILGTRAGQRAGTLSGGEQQMLALARALMARPRLLLLDEPSLGLAPLIIAQIFEIIRQINKEEGTPIFLVEQNANLALKMANRAYVIENGSIALSGLANDLLGDAKVKQAYLGIAE